MGIMDAPARVRQTAGRGSARRVRFRLDIGALYEANFEIDAVAATSPVVFGEARDAPSLGAVALETVALMLNPLSRALTPMRLLLPPLCG